MKKELLTNSTEKERTKKKLYKSLCLSLAAGTAMTGTLLNAAELTQTLKAVYNNISISYNGQIKALSTEPFIVDGKTYVPLRAVSEIMGADINWANNTVYITQQNISTVSSEQEIAAKNLEIVALKQQLELANTELKTYTETSSGSLTSATVTNTLNQIEDDYFNDYGIDWNFDLYILSDRLQLTVYYDSRYDDVLDETTESQRKTFIKNICYDIASNHTDLEIRGTLEDSRKNVEIAEFKYTSSGSFTYSETVAYSLSEFETELEYDYESIDCIGFTIPINYIDLAEDDDILTVTITTDLTPNSYDYRGDWNDLSSYYKYRLKDLLDDIISDIEYVFNDYYKIDMIIKDTYYGTMATYTDGYLYLHEVDEY